MEQTVPNILAASAASVLRAATGLQATPPALNNLGLTLISRGKDLEAIPFLRRALAGTREQYLVLMNLGTAYKRSNQPEASRRAYEQGLKLAEKELDRDPRDGLVRSRVAFLCARLGNRARAESEIAQALRLSPEDANAQEALPNVPPLALQDQQATNWCWAAVAVSLNDFLNPPSPVAGPAWTQATLATQLLKQQGITSKCTDVPVSRVCNRPEALDAALAITQNLRPSGALFDQHLTFQCMENWVSVQLPVGARIKWCGLGAHFIVLDGIKLMSSGQQMVHVQDPDPQTAPALWDYDALADNYRESGYWNDTYLVIARNSQV